MKPSTLQSLKLTLKYGGLGLIVAGFIMNDTFNTGTFVAFGLPLFVVGSMIRNQT